MHLYLNPSRVAEDDRLRSSYMRELVREAAPTQASASPASIPKVIVQYWHDSDAIPADVKECISSWEPLTAMGFKRLLFDDAKAKRFIARHYDDLHVSAFEGCPHPAMRCDYFRLCYMFRRGGFYVDADEVYLGGEWRSWFLDNRLKVHPLCYDVDSDTMVRSAVFTRNKVSSRNWIFYVNNNPIFAPPSHPIIRLALARSTKLLANGTPEPLDIQSTTGPGNLTASLVRHSIACTLAGKARDFILLTNWHEISASRWPLSYRGDERNWRLWKARS